VRLLVRYALPLVVIAGGVVAMAVVGPGDERYLGGAAIIGAGLAIALLNFFFRMGVSGDEERVAEEEAREYFDRHGHWPDEEPR
jgi:hypothetical protein